MSAEMNSVGSANRDPVEALRLAQPGTGPAGRPGRPGRPGGPPGRRCPPGRHSGLRPDRRGGRHRCTGGLPPVRPGAPVGHRPPARARVHQGHVLRGLRPGARPVPGGPGHPQAARGRAHLPPGVRHGDPCGQRRGAAAGPLRGTHPGRGGSGHRPPPSGAAPPEGPAGAGGHPGRGGGAGERRAGQPSPRPGRGRGGHRGTAIRTWARSSWPGRPTGPAWRRSAARPGCTRTGCPAISRTSPRRQPPRCQGSARPGQTPGGGPCCTGSDSLTCPATCRSVTSGSTARSTPWPLRSA